MQLGVLNIKTLLGVNPACPCLEHGVSPNDIDDKDSGIDYLVKGFAGTLNGSCSSDVHEQMSTH